MFQNIINALFGCSHNRTTFPLTPSRKTPNPATTRNGTYIVCLDCGKELAYDWSRMRVGSPVPVPVASSEAQPALPYRG